MLGLCPAIAFPSFSRRSDGRSLGSGDLPLWSYGDLGFGQNGQWNRDLGGLEEWMGVWKSFGGEVSKK